MKFSLRLPGLFALSGHFSNGHTIKFSNRRKDTTYVSIPPPPTSTPRVCDRTIQCVLYMWRRSNTPPRTHIHPPWFYYAPETWTPLPYIYSCTLLYPVLPKQNTGCTPLLWSYQYLLAVPPSKTSLPPRSVFYETIWGCAPLCGRRLHIRKCCVH